MRTCSPLRTHDEAGTHRAGLLLGGLARPNDVIALSGNLGAGKTAFVQGIAEGLGVVGHVPSPTFNLLLVHGGDTKLFHFDLYRLDDAGQLEDIGFHEILESGGVTAIEWADRFPAELPVDRLDIRIDVLGDSERSFVAVPTGPGSSRLCVAWSAAWAAAGEGAAS